MKITEADLFRYTLPLQAPLRLGDLVIEQREGFLLRLTTEAGVSVWGDAAPLPGFSAESLPETEAVLRRVLDRLQNAALPEDDFETFRDAQVFTDQNDLSNCSAYFAVESALLDLIAKSGGDATPLQNRVPAKTIQLNALLPATEDDAALQTRAADVVEAGYPAVKLKVGAQSLHADIQRTKAVRAAIGPEVAFRLDANRAWDRESAFIFAQAVRTCMVEYIEEPVDDPILLPDFFAKTGMPYALDETLQRPADVLMRGDALPGGAANALEFFGALLRDAAAWVWKPTLLQRPIMDTALQLNPKKPVVLSGAFESGVGHAAVVRYAAAYSGAGVPVGLDTYRFLGDDVLQHPLPLDRPEVKVAEVLAAAEWVDLARIEAL